MIFISKCKLLFHTYTTPFEFRSSLNKKNNNFPPRKKESISGGRGVVGHPWPGYRGVLFTSVWKYSPAHASTISSSSLLFSLSLSPCFALFARPLLLFLLHKRKGIYPPRSCVPSFFFFFPFLHTRESRWQLRIRQTRTTLKIIFRIHIYISRLILP